MNTQSHLTAIVHEAKHPQRPIKSWGVYRGRELVYESIYVGLCYEYRNIHDLQDCKIKAIR